MTLLTTLRFERPKTRIEVRVELKRIEPRDGQLSTDLEPITEPYNELSISMGSWVRNSPRARWGEDCFGQCVDYVRSFANHCAEPVAADLKRLCEIWRVWHLNGLKAGTTAQDEAIQHGRAAGEIQDGYFYDSARAALASVGLLEDRGHTYGSKWLVKRLPADVCAEVVAICGRLEAAREE